MDGHVLVGRNRSTLVDGFTDNVDDSAESFGSDWHHNGSFRVADSLSSDKAFCGVESDRSYIVSAQMLRNLKH